ncbi:unnamed protein product [Penicillium pancosmium]
MCLLNTALLGTFNDAKFLVRLYITVLGYWCSLFGVYRPEVAASPEYRSYGPSPKKALLIASPYGGLQGTINDVKSVDELLRSHGFSIKKCCGPEATRDGILDAWNDLISQLNKDDTVFVYYSGHGGLVEPPKIQPKERRFQFIVPIDYDHNGSDEFRGILDVEISLLVQRTTEKTKNVTVAFDCCHSGRIARHSKYGKDAIPRGLPKTIYRSLSTHLHRLQETGKINPKEIKSLEGNENAVRIVAAADTEVAWEHTNSRNQRVGAATQALVSVLDQALKTETSWKYVALRICEIVKTRFPSQHPHVEGPCNRVVFSQETKDFAPFLVKEESGQTVLHAGRIAGVREGSVYKIMPFDAEAVNQNQPIAKGTVKMVSSFWATLSLDSIKKIEGVGFAVIQNEAPCRYPVHLADDLRDYKPMVENSKLIRPFDDDEEGAAIAYIDRHGHAICVSDASHRKCALFENSGTNQSSAAKQAVQQAEWLSRAGNLLALKPEKAEQLCHRLQIVFKTTRADRELPLDGTADIQSNDRILITLENQGEQTIFVSVFDINAAGKISRISNGSPRGIRLEPQNQYTLGQQQHFGANTGMGMSWPKNLPIDDVREPVSESLICIATNKEIDLHYIASPERQGVPRGDASQLEKLAYQLSYGQGRDCEGDEENEQIKWDLIHVPFLLYRAS